MYIEREECDALLSFTALAIDPMQRDAIMDQVCIPPASHSTLALADLLRACPVTSDFSWPPPTFLPTARQKRRR